MARPKKKPDYDPEIILRELQEAVVKAYYDTSSLRSIGDQFDLNPIKVRKLLITAGVYESEAADEVNDLYGKGKTAAEIMELTGLSKQSINSYLPYKKGVYKGIDISATAKRLKVYRERNAAVENLKKNLTEDNLWSAIIFFQNYPFKTASGLPFKYMLKTGRNGELTKELWIDRRENSKSLAWSSVKLAFQNAGMPDEIPGPKALGKNIRGVSYIYPIFWRFGIIKVPENVEKKMEPK